MKQRIKLAVLSVFALLVAMAIFQLLQWSMVHFGAVMSGFKGHIGWYGLKLVAYYDAWNLSHVLYLYLIPYIVFLAILVVMLSGRIKSSNFPTFFGLLYNWSFLILIVWVLFLPLWEVVDQKGIFYALSWLGFSRMEQYAFGLIMMALFFIYLFRVSAMFSVNLLVPRKQYVDKASIRLQLVYLWYLPVVALTIAVLFLSQMKFSSPNNYFIDGVFVTILLNAFYIKSYDVIV